MKAFLPILSVGIALLVRPSGVLAQAATARVSAEVVVLPERGVIEQGLTRTSPPDSMALAGPLGRSASAPLVQGHFVRVATHRDADIIRTQIDFTAN